jgi:hypothetical protein
MNKKKKKKRFRSSYYLELTSIRKDSISFFPPYGHPVVPGHL